MKIRRLLLWAAPFLFFVGLWAYSFWTWQIVRLSYPRQINGLFTMRAWKLESGIGFFKFGMEDQVSHDVATAQLFQQQVQSSGKPFPHWYFFHEHVESADVPDLIWFCLHEVGGFTHMRPRFDSGPDIVDNYIHDLVIPYWIPVLAAAIVLWLWLRRQRLRRAAIRANAHQPAGDPTGASA